MTAIDLAKGVTSLVVFATTTVGVAFGNFVLRRADASILGVTLPHRSFHYVLGPILVLVNGAVLLYLLALTQTSASAQEISEIKKLQVWGKLGPVFNPFYVGGVLASAIGYAFLIVLWWVGMHAFIYSIQLNPGSSMLFAWQVVVTIMYLSLGLASIIAIQLCWSQWRIGPYRVKWAVGLVGIVIGAFGVPLILRLGAPSLFRMLRGQE